MRNPRIHVLREHTLEGFVLRVELMKVVGETAQGVADVCGDMTEGVHESHARML